MELSKEMQQEVMKDLDADTVRMHEKIQQVNPAWQQQYHEYSMQDLEQLIYITEQMRLKLRMLGAPRASW